MKTKLLAHVGMGALAAVVGFGQPSYAADESQKIEKVTVTAQRRSATLQKVPVSVTAVTADKLEKSQTVNNQNLDAVTPGLTTTSVQGASQMFIRGVGSQSTIPGTESSVATYVDGVYFASATGTVFALPNINRIEVLRGPQGTLFGRNATGGVVQVITKRPDFETAYNASLTYGNYNTATGAGYLTGKVTDQIAANLALYGREQGDGYGKNLFAGRPQDLNSLDEYAARVQVLLEPAETFSLLLSADVNHQKNDLGAVRQPFQNSRDIFGNQRVGSPFDGNYNYPTRARSTNYGFSGTADLDLGFATLESISALRWNTFYQTYDQDLTPVQLLDVYRNDYNRTGQQELLLQGSTHGLDWTVGVFYLDYINKLRPLSTFAAPVSATNAHRYTTDEISSIAGYAQTTYALTDNFNITAGARYTQDQSVLNGVLLAAPGNPNPVNSVLVHVENKELRASRLTWTFIADWQITDDFFAYASASRGFKSGQFNTTSIAQIPTRPETLDAYEAGVKSDWFDDRLRLNATVFHYDYTDIQLVQVAPPPINIQTLNAASGEMDGAEFELLGLPIATDKHRLEIGATLTLLDATYTSFPNSPYFVPRPFVAAPPGVICNPPSSAAPGGNQSCLYDATGARMIRTPEWTLGASLDYSMQLGLGELGLAANVYHTDGFFWEPSNRLRQAPYTLWNGELTFRPSETSWEIGLFGRNLTDELYYVQLSEQALADSAAAAPPRTYGVLLRYRSD